MFFGFASPMAKTAASQLALDMFSLIAKTPDPLFAVGTQFEDCTFGLADFRLRRPITAYLCR
jgi:hypothetical protein